LQVLVAAACANIVAAGRRVLPRGWGDFARQLAIWFGFLAAYQVARGLADRNPARAFQNGLDVIDIESRVHGLIELSLQNIVVSSHFLSMVAGWTYWNSEFSVVGLALLWVYVRRHGAFYRFRNTILVANVLGLIGYVVLPTAPPRMFPDFGFRDSLATMHGLNSGSGLVQLAANPYAAMPSLHAADALIVGVVLASLCRRRIFKALWLLWPGWVWFTVMATGNHFWLDVAGGIFLAAVALWLVYRPRRGRRAEPAAA
jgi:membrane-associated phospholipid phosphatase